ncbi:hypothetical protein Ahy_B05g076891 [Arachis hypogaea]|uniref:Uncharacterized protein n=1 Tax=Arachis hypogaea TaxID=3818 RepID=A0A444Z469_ARAHY|nr:hypothetical protein Ahy_B05g076891 [Arachis hypogaea]
MGQAIANIETQDGSLKELSHNDSFARVLGNEHSGRVQGIGFGPSPTKIMSNTIQQSNSGVQIEKIKGNGSRTKGKGSRRKGKETNYEESVEIHNLIVKRYFAT